MRAEHLKRWLATARKAKMDNETAGKEEATTVMTTERARTYISAAQKETESENWTRVVDLV